jgi:hypothetical protein
MDISWGTILIASALNSFQLLIFNQKRLLSARIPQKIYLPHRGHLFEVDQRLHIVLKFNKITGQIQFPQRLTSLDILNNSNLILRQVQIIKLLQLIQVLQFLYNIILHQDLLNVSGLQLKILYHPNIQLMQRDLFQCTQTPVIVLSALA